MGYDFLIRKLMTSNKFINSNGFGYTLLQPLIEALNIVYPIDNLDTLKENNNECKKNQEKIKDISK